MPAHDLGRILARHWLLVALVAAGLTLRWRSTDGLGAAPLACLVAAAAGYVVCVRWGCWRWLAALAALPAVVDPRMLTDQGFRPWCGLVLVSVGLLGYAWTGLREPVGAARGPRGVVGGRPRRRRRHLRGVARPRRPVAARATTGHRRRGPGRPGRRVRGRPRGSPGASAGRRRRRRCRRVVRRGRGRVVAGRRRARPDRAPPRPPRPGGRALPDRRRGRGGARRLPRAVRRTAARPGGDRDRGLQRGGRASPRSSTRCPRRLRARTPTSWSSTTGARTAPPDALAGSRAVVARCPVNRGQGAALRLGYRIAREHGAAYVITTDADGQYDVGDLPARPPADPRRPCRLRHRLACPRPPADPRPGTPTRRPRLRRAGDDPRPGVDSPTPRSGCAR